MPAYEPDRKMLGIISELGKSGFDVVVVDDGSGVGYSQLFEEAAERLPGREGRGVTLLIHEKNRGKGAALRTGMDFINNFMVIKGEEQQNVIVTVDADGQHLVKDVARTATAAASTPGTLVLGSRSIGCGTAASEVPESSTSAQYKVPMRSAFGNTVTRQVFQAVSGVGISDTQTGLRAFTADLIPDLLASRGDRYEYELNVLLDFADAGIPIREIPIETVYLDGNRSSHFNTIRDSYRIYKEIGAHMMQSKSQGMIQGDTQGGSQGKTQGKIHGKTGIAGQAAKFSLSSFVSFLVDYALYSLLLLVGAELIFANIGARVISSTVNFAINRKIVFKSSNSLASSAIRYFALAIIILTGNTIVLNTLVGSLGINRMVAKVMTEIIFFIISWTVQKYVIFYSGTEDNSRETQKRRDIYAKY